MKSPGKERSSSEVKLKRSMKPTPVHSKVVTQCRDVLLKSLNPDVFCNQSFLSKLPAVFRQDGQDCDQRTERLSHFIDTLEHSDDRTFVQFMELLKKHNKSVYNVLEQTMKTMEDADGGDCIGEDESLSGERATLTGFAVRDLLKRQRCQINSRLYEDYVSGSLVEAEVKESGGYIACHVVAARGDGQERPWMRHDKRRRIKDPSERKEPFMGVLLKDLIVKLIKITDIPDLVKKPTRCTQAYVVDEKNLYSFSAPSQTLNNNVHTMSTLRLSSYRGDLMKNEDARKIRSAQTPPPLPPKPDSLSPLPKLKFQSRYNRNHSDDKSLRPESSVEINVQNRSAFTLPPPIPERHRGDANTKPHVPLVQAPNPTFRQVEPVNMVQISSYPKAFKNYEADDAVDDDNISLNYLIEPEDLYEHEGPYEAIDQNAYNEFKELTRDVETQPPPPPPPLPSKLSDSKDEIKRVGDLHTAETTFDILEVTETSKNANPVSGEEHSVETTLTQVSNTLLEEQTDNADCTDVSVSRSSSGVSTTVKTRDSGVDSVVSHSLHESPFCATDTTEDLDTLIPEALDSHPLDQGVKAFGSAEPSYYEDIDLMNNDHSSHYLDPRSDEPDGYPGSPFSSSDQKVLTAGTLLMSDCVFACKFENSSCNEYLDDNHKAKLVAFRNTRICYDREGTAYYIQVDRLKKFGDPMGEPWFYPIALSIKEATLFLRQEGQKGCFVVYQSSDSTSEACAYFLSLSGEGSEVVHYPIVENYCGDVMIEGHDKSFLTLFDLVQYFRRNKNCLLTRLRRPLRESRLPIIPGHHYPANYELSRKSVRLYGKIITEGKFGLTCLGSYGQQQVFLKALQNDSVVEEDDDFLNEALILMTTNHENIIKLIGVCFRNRPFFILTENFGVGSLKESLLNGFLSDKGDTYFDLCVQMVSAMAHLERQRYIIHRDLSTINFLLSANYTVKLFNFERARRTDDDSYLACSSEEVPIRWSPPEVLRDSFYSTKSDVWSLGVVFWELFSQGQLPYGHLSDQEVALYVADKGRLEKPQECELFIFSIMTQCWRYRASDRPSFATLESKVKGQCNFYFINPQRKFSDVASPLHSSASFSDDMQTTHQLTLKSVKGNSQSESNTPLVSTPTLHFRSGRAYTDLDPRLDDYIRTTTSNNISSGNKNHRQTLFASSYDCSSTTPNAGSSTLPLGQFSSGEISRGHKMRKSLRNLLKVTSKIGKHANQ